MIHFTAKAQVLSFYQPFYFCSPECNRIGLKVMAVSIHHILCRVLVQQVTWTLLLLLLWTSELSKRQQIRKHPFLIDNRLLILCLTIFWYCLLEQEELELFLLMEELPACLNYMFCQGLLLCVAISLFIFLPTILLSEQNQLTRWSWLKQKQVYYCNSVKPATWNKIVVGEYWWLLKCLFCIFV